MLLADEFIERPRPHTGGERLGLREIGFLGLAKEFDGQPPFFAHCRIATATGILFGRKKEGNVMSASTVSISEASHRILKELAERTGQSMTDVLSEALDTYRRKVFVDAVNAGYAEMQADPQEWAEHLAERQAWEATVADGLEPGEQWTGL